MDTFLLRMIEWNAEALKDWNFVPPPNGKRMASWVSDEIWLKLQGLFSAKEGWTALKKTMELFQKLTAETALKLGYSDQKKMSGKMMVFINNLNE